MSDDIGLAALRNSLHARDSGSVGQFYRRKPSQIDFLLSRIVWRAPPPVGKIAAIHKVPLVADRVVFRRPGGVDVGQSQRVRVFVANGSYAARHVSKPQLGTGSVVGDFCAVRTFHGTDGASVGPQIAVTLLAALVAGISCSDINHLIHISIAVPVILFIVQVGVVGYQRVGGLFDGRCAIVLGAACRVGVWLCLHRRLIWSEHIEDHVKQPCRLLSEVVGHAARPHSLVVALLVEYLIVIALRVVALKIGINIRHQYYQLPVGAVSVPMLVGCWQPLLLLPASYVVCRQLWHAAAA